MARFYFESGVHSGTLRDGHTFNCAPATRRFKPDEQFGAPADKPRTLGVVETECPSCIRDLSDARHGASTNPATVPLNFDELSYQLGKATKTRSTVQSLVEQLQSLAEA